MTKIETNMIAFAKKRNQENEKGFKILSAGVILLMIIFAIIIASVTPQTHAGELTNRDKIRIERLQACQEAFDERKDEIDYKYSWEVNDLIVKCAIRMHGVYIVESAT